MSARKIPQRGRVGLAVAVAMLAGACTTLPPERPAAPAAAATSGFDHAPFDRLLARIVDALSDDSRPAAEAREELLDYRGLGMSVMEISHRSSHFDEMADATEACLRRLLNISDDYAVLFLAGGATTQFAQVPLNLAAPQRRGAYIVDGEGRTMTPGLIDMHTHLREPGQEYKETIESGARAAAAGGGATNGRVGQQE